MIGASGISINWLRHLGSGQKETLSKRMINLVINLTGNLILVESMHSRARQRAAKQRRCVYCNEINHTSINCPKVVTSVDRKKHLGQRQLCFNGANIHRTLC